MNEKRIENIQKMEVKLNEIQAFIKEAENVLEKWEKTRITLDELMKYYESEQWREDYDASNEGKILAGIPHGVLIQDAVYDAFTDYKTLSEDYQALLQKIIH